MKTLSQKTTFNINAVCIAVALACSPSVVGAQESTDNSDAGVEVISVKGIRASLAKAVATKRASHQFVDAISADDIGKLPDTNVAESLQRVSGVQIDRGIGGGSDISIRGLRNNVVLVNGRQITEAGGRGSRGPDTLESSSYGLLAIMPSKLVSRLEVSKQAGSDQIEGALGGVVNIVTRKPLDNPGQQILGSVTGIYSDLPDDTGNELFGLYSNTFADDTIGIQISTVLANQEVREDGLNTFSGYQLLGPGDLDNYDPNGDGVGGLVFRDMRFWQINDERERTGVNAIFQYAPDASSEYYIDSFYSKMESDRQRYWTGFWNCCGFIDPVFSDNEVLMSASVARPVQSNTEYADASSEFLSTAVGGKWSGDNWTTEAEIAFTDAESNLDQQFIRLQTASAADVFFDLDGGSVPELSFGGVDLTQPDDLNLTILYDNLFLRETKDTAARVDFTRHLDGDLTSFEFGARYNKLDTDVNIRQVDIRPNFVLNDIASNVSDFTRLFASPDFFSGDTTPIHREYLVVNEATWNNCETLNSLYDAAQNAECQKGFDPLGSFDVEEEFLSFYAKANFDLEVGEKVVSGNFGIRYVDRDLTSIGNLIEGDTVRANVATKSDKEMLPSAVVKVDWTDDFVVRAGMARVLSFAKTADLNNGLRVYGDRTGSGGSPNLEPFLINQADLSFEWYFNPESLLSLGLFYKDVDSFIVETVQARTIPGYDDEITVSQQVNGEGGSIKGLELLYQQPFSGIFENFGAMATYSFIDSKTPFTDVNGNVLPIPGLSENNVNLVLYYEKDAIGLRLAYNWRDEYLDSVGNGDTGIYSDSYSDLVASAKWDLSDTVTLSFEGVNLLNTRQEQYNAYTEATRRNVEFGRIYKASISMKF